MLALSPEPPAQIATGGDEVKRLVRLRVTELASEAGPSHRTRGAVVASSSQKLVGQEEQAQCERQQCLKGDQRRERIELLDPWMASSIW